MRVSFKQPDLGLAPGSTRRPVNAPARGYTNGFLTLPHLSKTVPVRSVAEKADQKWLQIAKLCAELVEENEVEIHDQSTARDIVTATLSIWASKHCANISVLDGFDLIASIDTELLSYNCYAEEAEKLEKENWFIGFQSTQVTRYFNIKDKIEKLERMYPGLGRTALSYAERASYQTITALSPEVGFYLGQHIYWYGMDNDEDYKFETEAYGEETPGEEVFLPSDYRKAFSKPFLTGACLKRKALKGIAVEQNIAGETARAVLSIMDLIKQEARLPDLSGHDVEGVYFSCYLGIGGDNDMIERVLDDHMNYANQASDGFTAMHGIATVPLDRAAFQKWRAGIEKGFALYTQLDHLIQLVGEIRN
jgi:PRTRC genetic system protein F